jgi:DUF971 family protein
MNPRPNGLALDEQGDLVIDWNDGKKRHYKVAKLRDTCPCATCREKRSAAPQPGLLPVLTMAETQPVKITAMKPVGSYAYGITFSDGHDTGIYTIEQLFELGTELG